MVRREILRPVSLWFRMKQRRTVNFSRRRLAMKRDPDPIDWPILVGLLLVAAVLGWLGGWYLGTGGGGK